ncbi:hypothetical protein [Falsiroseomonas sp. E2-1-a20]|uniref:hypothetical protein n=1 Tax=Falsiroseomonas sp. E2-1-a20 TaxID=3239300 RepID=UPI003F34F318
MMRRATLAAERSARAAEWQAELTAFQAALSLVGSIALLYTLYLTLKSLRSAREANEQQRHLFIADQRPWVSVRAELIHLEYWGEQLGLKIRFTVKNSGKTPSLHVWIASEFRPHTVGQAIWDLQRDLAARIRTTYQERSTQGDPILGFSVLPGDERRHEQVYSVHKEEVAEGPNVTPRWRRQPHIIGCVTYSSEAAPFAYQTLFILELRQGGESGSSSVDLDPEKSLFRDVVVMPYFVGDHAI